MAITPKKNKPVTIRLDDETYEKIEKIAIQNKSSVSYEIRRMIDFFIESKKKLENK